MDARAILARKRDAKPLSRAEIDWFAAGLANGAVTDAQAGAFAMAVLLNGMTKAERIALTKAMRDSGDVQHWDLPGPVLDKHSTGGVGDNVSLMLAPALAACGAYVPMISGRGLGHTGGTLDKLDAIPGYQSEVDAERLHQVVAATGCAIVGASGQIAPADKRLYGVRDVTATVESIDLICASILSKKLAAGLDGLVLDVKRGSGAFMAADADARALAKALVSVTQGAGCGCAALMTDMNQPLASAAGNALEVENAIRFLRGDAIDSRLWDVCVALGGTLLHLGGLADGAAAGADMIARAFETGTACACFAEMVAALGGPVDLVENWGKYLPRAPLSGAVAAPRAGFLAAADTRALGRVVLDLGGGRMRQGDRLDYAVGLYDIAPLGAFLEAGEPIAMIAAPDADALARAEAGVLAAIRICTRAPAPDALIAERIE